MLKKHANSQWHRDASAVAAIYSTKTASGVSMMDEAIYLVFHQPKWRNIGRIPDFEPAGSQATCQ